MPDPNTNHVDDQTRAKIAALTHEAMTLVEDLQSSKSADFYCQLEEMHDHYRWLDNTDICERIDFDVTLTPLPTTERNGTVGRQE